MVAAEGAGRIRLLGVGEGLHPGQADEGAGSPLLHVLFGEKGRADGPHDARIGSPDDLAARVLLHGPEHRVIAEGTALNHNPVPQAVQVGDADDLGKYIFYDGAAQARHDVPRQLAVSLLRDDAAVHEYRAAAPQHCGIL